jgi:NAD(P)H dehydrogenase (quinone)
MKPTLFVTSATGKVGGTVLSTLAANPSVQVVAGVRSPERIAEMKARGIAARLFDFDRPETHAAALEGVSGAFLGTGYSVDMLRQSKDFLDAAKAAKVGHIVHLGVSASPETRVGHWVWHRYVESYVERLGFRFTHLNPEWFMQNLIGYGGKANANPGVVRFFVNDCRVSWVDAEDVGHLAAVALAEPDRFAGQRIALGHDVLSFPEVCAIIGEISGKPYRYEQGAPEEFFEQMMKLGAEPAYMACVRDHFRWFSERSIPGQDGLFDTYERWTGRKPVRWTDFVAKHRDVFAY